MLTLPVLQMGFQVPSGAVWSNSGIKINTRQLRHDNAFAKADTGGPRAEEEWLQRRELNPACVSVRFLCIHLVHDGWLFVQWLSFFFLLPNARKDDWDVVSLAEPDCLKNPCDLNSFPKDIWEEIWLPAFCFLSAEGLFLLNKTKLDLWVAH